jgi:hypothetical protein
MALLRHEEIRQAELPQEWETWDDAVELEVEE